MYIPEVDFQSVIALIKAKLLHRLDGEEWHYVLLSIVDECYDTEFLDGRTEVGFEDLFKMHHIEGDTDTRFVRFFEEEIALKDRKAFGSALSFIVEVSRSNSYPQTQDGLEKAYMQLLRHLLIFSSKFNGLVDSNVAMTVAFDRKIDADIRRNAIHCLRSRDFASTPSDNEWQALENEIELLPELAPPFIERLTDDLESPRDGLELLAYARALTDEQLTTAGFEMPVRAMLQKLHDTRYSSLNFAEDCEDFSSSLIKWLTQIMTGTDYQSWILRLPKIDNENSMVH